MIYEFRTYDIKPGMIVSYQKAFEEKLGKRQVLSPLFGHWYTEIGPINQIIAIWPYNTLQHRKNVRRKAESGPNPIWPPKTGEFVVNMTSKILLPAPFMKSQNTTNMGPIYEMRSYTYMPEDLPDVLDQWACFIDARENYSPMIGCWYTNSRGLENWVHIWAYHTFEDRLKIREEVSKKGVWPPQKSPPPIAQTAKIMLPAPFSPLK